MNEESLFSSSTFAPRIETFVASSQVRFDITGFYTDISELIEFDFVSGRPENLGNVTTSGLETSGELDRVMAVGGALRVGREGDAAHLDLDTTELRPVDQHLDGGPAEPVFEDAAGSRRDLVLGRVRRGVRGEREQRGAGREQEGADRGGGHAWLGAPSAWRIPPSATHPKPARESSRPRPISV